MGLYLEVQLGQSGRRPLFVAFYGGVPAPMGRLETMIRRIAAVGFVTEGPLAATPGPIAQHIRLVDRQVFEEEVIDVASCRGRTEARSGPRYP